MVCKKCGAYNDDGWCQSCQVSHLRKDFINWTSGNEKIDNLIQEMQLKIDSYDDIIFEWIPYSQFDYIKGNSTSGLCFAIWKDGPLYCKNNEEEYTRNQNKNVTLKYIYNFQNIAAEV
jgi:hypothetical protein